MLLHFRASAYIALPSIYTQLPSHNIVLEMHKRRRGQACTPFACMYVWKKGPRWDCQPTYIHSYIHRPSKPILLFSAMISSGRDAPWKHQQESGRGQVSRCYRTYSMFVCMLSGCTCDLRFDRIGDLRNKHPIPYLATREHVLTLPIF